MIEDTLTDRIIVKFVFFCFFTVNAPFVPEVSSPTDTSNFDVDESDFRHTVSSLILFYRSLVVERNCSFKLNSTFLWFCIMHALEY